MSDAITQKLEEMGVVLPEPAKPAASYVGFMRHGETVIVSGQLPLIDGKLELTGHLGKGVTIEDAQKAARTCAINILAQIKVACDGDLSRIKQCIRLGGFVASTPEFTDQHLVINGASDFIGEALGEKGIHARAAVGVASLPLNAAVEVDAMFVVE